MEQLTEIQQINRAIMFGNFSNVELTSIVNAVQFARAQLTKQKIRSFTKGDSVKFTSNRNGQTYTGTVRKVAIKYITVDTGQTLFRVPASMLEAV
jgi:competence protein ComGF